MASELLPEDEAYSLAVVDEIEQAGYSVSTRALSPSLLLSSAGGVFGSGAAALSPALLPVFGYIVAGGVIGYSLNQICDLSIQFFELLDDYTKLALEEWAAGDMEEPFVLDATTAAAMQNAFNLTFLGDAGAFATLTGVTFDASVLPAFSHDFYLNSDILPSGLFEFTLQKNAPVVLGSTGLMASLIETNVFPNSKYALKIVNGSTGVVGLYQIARTWEDYIDTAESLLISLPTVATRTGSNGAIGYALNWFICAVGSTAAMNTYFSFASGDGEGFAYLDGLTNYVYNQRVISQSLVDENYTWLVDGEALSLQYSAAMANVGTSVAVSQDEKYAAKPLAPGDVIYRPQDLSDVSDYSADYARTGDKAVDVPTTGDDNGFWARLWLWLDAILAAITDIPDTFAEAINTLLESIAGLGKAIADNLGLERVTGWIKENVLLALQLAFIPDEGFFDEYFADLKSTFEDRFGLLTYPISVIYDFCNSLLSIGNKEPVLSWKSWSYEGTTLIKAGSFNFNDIINSNDIFKTIYNIYLTVVDVAIIFMFLRFINTKYRSVINS